MGKEKGVNTLVDFCTPMVKEGTLIIIFGYKKLGI